MRRRRRTKGGEQQERGGGARISLSRKQRINGRLPSPAFDYFGCRKQVDDFERRGQKRRRFLTQLPSPPVYLRAFLPWNRTINCKIVKIPCHTRLKERGREKYFRPMSNFYSGPLQCSLFAHTSTPVRSYSHPVVGWKVSHSRIYYHFFFLLFCLLAFCFCFFSLLPDRLPPSASVPGSEISPIIFVQINRSGKHGFKKKKCRK